MYEDKDIQKDILQNWKIKPNLALELVSNTISNEYL